MNDIEGKRVAMLAADGFEQSELMVPKERLEQAGAKVDIISLKTGEIWGWNHNDWGDAIPVDRTIDAVQVDEYEHWSFPAIRSIPICCAPTRTPLPSSGISTIAGSRWRRFVTLLGCWSRRDSSRAAR